MYEIYYEKCINTTMPYYPFFIQKLKQIQNISKKNNTNDISYQKTYYVSRHNNHLATLNNYRNIHIKKDCIGCIATKVYQLANIIWPNNIIHKIKNHQRYPSEYFIKVIINTHIRDNYVINPPIQLKNDQIPLFDYIPLHHNKLLILDALMHQGSYPRYLVSFDNENEKYIYSEHSGVITIRNKIIDSIIVSTETNRIDSNDNNIYLPRNISYFENHEYLFHTHPNTIKYGGRIKEGIIYEFPSSNDILNFIKYHNQGKAQLSLIIAPEGIYVIRPIRYQKVITYDPFFFDFFSKFIIKLEKIAISRIKEYINMISDPDVFHKYIGGNMNYIKAYNRFIEPLNLFVEFYPRVKKNGEWMLQQINLQYLDL